ncbi:hypothetical protein AKJ38_02370 [candidate division MSBL1 archaeon SCGC-AAA259I14]|uniref:DNA methylase N-4/N-6 domain-containing protein n=1 Tax=candidate division MSBL1 archaeon SCGC-AAA259I14 TaxID=1698268 RepID=A0A133URT8_9EURY|nr:hypothetical protein AKJ38_02370 [candidate division MSBL1 archaeon SCGC-AAA259I14]
MSDNNTEEVKLDDLVKDDSIYPRKNISRKTVESYATALRAGAKFPSITYQQVRENEEIKAVIIDGLHRKLAWDKLSEEEKDEASKIKLEPWKKGILDKEESLEELRIASVKFNLQHGDRLKETDLEMQCARIVEDRSPREIRGIKKELAEQFEVTKSRISQMKEVTKKYNQKVASRDSKIYKLSCLGCTQKEISEKVDINQPNVSKNIRKFSAKLSNILEIGEDEGKSISELSDDHGIDEPILWHKKLEGKPDIERGELFFDPDEDEYPFELYNLWRFSKCDERLGTKWPGNVPGQIAVNLLYYYTEQGNLVVDPMAGGGSTVDACLVMGRKCRAYDINPPDNQVSIQKHDITKGFPTEADDADFIFLDPPYWKQKEEAYDEESNNLASLPLDEFYDACGEIFRSAFSTLKKGGHIGMIIGPTQESMKIKDHVHVLYNLLKEEFDFTNRIIVPYSTQQAQAYDVADAEKKQYMLKVYRDLLVFEKGG